MFFHEDEESPVSTSGKGASRCPVRRLSPPISRSELSVCQAAELTKYGLNCGPTGFRGGAPRCAPGVDMPYPRDSCVLRGRLSGGCDPPLGRINRAQPAGPRTWCWPPCWATTISVPRSAAPLAAAARHRSTGSMSTGRAHCRRLRTAACANCWCSASTRALAQRRRQRKPGTAQPARPTSTPTTSRPQPSNSSLARARPGRRYPVVYGKPELRLAVAAGSLTLPPTR